MADQRQEQEALYFETPAPDDSEWCKAFWRLYFDFGNATKANQEKIDQLAAEVTQLETERDQINGIGGKLLISRDDWRRRAKAAEKALREVHEFHCGCDRPGDLVTCVAKPAEAFRSIRG